MEMEKEKEEPNQAKGDFNASIWGQRRAAEACVCLNVYSDLEPSDVNSTILWQALYMLGAVLSVCPKDEEDDKIQTLFKTLPEIIEYFWKNQKEDI